MHKTIVTALAILASTAAVAADLPSKTAAPATPASIPTFAQYYIGASVGGDLQKALVYSGGIVAGYNAAPYLAVESTYDFSRPQQKVGGKFNYENTVAINVVPQYKVPLAEVTAYAFGGLGYRWDTAKAVESHAIYNLGGGLKYEFAKNFELDGRYTRIDDVKPKYHKTSPTEDRGTVGVNYKF